MIQVNDNSRAMRVSMASDRPMSAGALTPLRGQAAHQDRDEDDVVDAEHDLQHGEGQQGDPGLGIGDPFKTHGDFSVDSRRSGRLTMGGKWGTDHVFSAEKTWSVPISFLEFNAERVVRVHPFHERQLAVLVRDLVDQPDPVADDALGGIVPGVVDAPADQRPREIPAGAAPVSMACSRRRRCSLRMACSFSLEVVIRKRRVVRALARGEAQSPRACTP